jgi:hypothetical protein
VQKTFDYSTARTGLSVWKNGLGRHCTNKLFQVWLSKESYEAVQAFLDKFSAGDTFPEQARNFLDWLGK